VFGKHPGGVQGRLVNVHHREFLVDLGCAHNDLEARYSARASGTHGLVLATTELGMDID
jgi:hypothetical protein